MINEQIDPAAFERSISRRTFLQRSAYGLGGIAFGVLASGSAQADNAQAGAIGRCLHDKHFLRKHGKDAYYGQPKEKK